jgi:hypothetical protein
MTLEARGSEYGMSVDLPAGWEGHIWAPGYDNLLDAAGPILHAATFPLPPGDGSFGELAATRLDSADLFVGLIGVGSEFAHVGIYAPESFSVPSKVTAFDPTNSPAPVPGVSCLQQFGTVQNWGFCLYLMIGSAVDGDGLAAMRDVLSRVRVYAVEEPAIH